jgi:3-O-methylgallate 3,4-dioxygenase
MPALLGRSFADPVLNLVGKGKSQGRKVVMAEIVFGMAVPHSGILGKDPDTWPEDRERDMSNKREMWYRKRPWKFAELAHERRNDGFDALTTPEERRRRFDLCQVALCKMRKAYEDANVDVAVILGKDQQEMFPSFSPAFAIYTGEEIYNGPPGRSVYSPSKLMTHPGHPELALHLVRSLQNSGFDLTDLFKWMPNTWLQDQPIVPHAYGFVMHQIMGDQPPPCVPVLMNTFYPPTQPSIRRCIDFGNALTAAIRSWDSNKRVAIIASGGLTHFVCDEQQDAQFLELLKKNDIEGLAQIDERIYQSGTSEVKLYVPVLLAMKDTAPMTLVDYVPCYRSEAGTGEGMAFMYWAAGN